MLHGLELRLSLRASKLLRDARAMLEAVAALDDIEWGKNTKAWFVTYSNKIVDLDRDVVVPLIRELSNYINMHELNGEVGDSPSSLVEVFIADMYLGFPKLVREAKRVIAKISAEWVSKQEEELRARISESVHQLITEPSTDHAAQLVEDKPVQDDNAAQRVFDVQAKEFYQETAVEALRINPAEFIVNTMYSMFESEWKQDWRPRVHAYVQCWWDDHTDAVLMMQFAFHEFVIARNLPDESGLPLSIRVTAIDPGSGEPGKRIPAYPPARLLAIPAVRHLRSMEGIDLSPEVSHNIFAEIAKWMLTDADILDMEIGDKLVEFRFLFAPAATIDVSVENVYSAKRTEVILGLEAKVKEVGEKSPAAQVLHAVEKYKDPSVPLPVGLTDEYLRFLCLAAYSGAFGQLVDFDKGRRAQLVLHYYFNPELRLEDLQSLAEVTSYQRVSQLLKHATEYMWKRLPQDIPVGSPWNSNGATARRDEIFPLTRLQSSRATKGHHLAVAEQAETLADGDLHEAMRHVRAQSRHRPLRRGGAP